MLNIWFLNSKNYFIQILLKAENAKTAYCLQHNNLIYTIVLQLEVTKFKYIRLK